MRLAHLTPLALGPLTLAPLLLLALAGCGSAAPPAGQPSATAAPATAPATAPAAPPTGATSEAMRAYAAANSRMHAAMMQIDPDPDVAFVQGMIPHHRGAVEMAEIVLKHGKDPETQDLARRVIAAQRGEIAEMEVWLAKRGKAAAPATGGGEGGGHAMH